jgi:hypothetical protein
VLRSDWEGRDPQNAERSAFQLCIPSPAWSDANFKEKEKERGLSQCGDGCDGRLDIPRAHFCDGMEVQDDYRDKGPYFNG